MTPRHARPEVQPEASRVRFVDVLRIPTFGVLYAAETQSILGDQLARVALSVLVFERTGSAAATALTYALTFLPTILGGILLSGLGDRLSRRVVMIVVDVVRAVAFAAMAVPGLPAPALFTLLFAAVLIGPVFQSAEVATIADALDHDHYRVATALRMMTNQAAQVVGFAVGGVVVAALTPRWGLAIDAASFAVSALMVSVAPLAAARRAGGRHRTDAEVHVGDGLRALVAPRDVRQLSALALLAMFFVVPEGLAAPYADHLGHGEGSVGLLLAAIPLGGFVGAVLVARVVPQVHRLRTSQAMAVLTGLPLVACAWVHSLPVTLALWVLSGMFAAYMVEVMSRVAHGVPDEVRAGAVGTLAAVLTAGQGIGIAAFGWAADVMSARSVAALAGAIGSGLAAVVLVALRQSRHEASAQPDPLPSAHPLATIADPPPDGRQYVA